MREDAATVRTQNPTHRLARIAVALSCVALALSVTGLAPADAVKAVARALSAKNSDAVDGLSASRRPRPGQLIALDSAGRMPVSVIPPLVTARGPRGPEGPAGAEGPRGPSEAFVDSPPAKSLSAQANASTTVAKVSGLPAGDYVLSFTAQAVDFANGGEIVSCDIRANGEAVGGASIVVGNGAGSVRSGGIGAITGATLNPGSNVALDCRSDQALSQPPEIHNQHLSAVRVGTLHATNGG